jgi:hypothetical protein
VAVEDRTIRLVGTVRLVVAAGVIGLIGAIVWASLVPLAWGGVIALTALFVVLVVVHQRAFARRARAEAVKCFHERGIERMTGRWAEHPRDGAAFKSEGHPYSGDLDIFGRASLFQLLATTETSFGERALAASLSPAAVPAIEDSAWRDDVVARQVAVKELAGKLSFRERLSAVTHVVSSEKPDPMPFVEWAETAKPLSPPAAVRLVSWVLPVLAIAAMAFASRLGPLRMAWVAVVLLELGFLAWQRARVAPILLAASSKEGSLGRFEEVFRVLEDGTSGDSAPGVVKHDGTSGDSAPGVVKLSPRFDAPLLRKLEEELRAGGAEVTREMARLGRIISFVDARQNEVFRLFVAPVLLWDFHCAVALDRWRSRVGLRIRRWFEVLGEIEALASLATLPFDSPSYAWPEPTPGAGFEATALGHPLLPASSRVDNDVSLPGPAGSPKTGRALIVTGSNMSGKSTLLRAIGINAVLAMAGAPVCAKRLAIGRVSVATSMRVSDSLEAGVSHFFAELKTLRRVVDLAKERPPVLFLLDEILHGTNSRERLIGARAIVRSLTDLGAFGAVSTHDLGIAKPVPELEGRVRNVHFQEQVDATGTMTFDYLLREGVVESSNALRLMRAVGLDVPGD